MQIDYSKYLPNWKTEIRQRIMKRANNMCEFVIGVDSYQGENAYTLLRKKGISREVILSKTRNDDFLFKTEVITLAKYFNAIIISEID